MARSPRIEFPNAWYHIMNRGAGRRVIFPTDELKEKFLELLAEIHAEYEVEIHAYCLMNNHYHLLVRTPHANLNLAMQKLASNYSRAHNRTLKIDGPLFKGRYKAILVAEAIYLAQVSRYIHRNPVEAKLVINPREYGWSSYPAYCNLAARPPWLHMSESVRRVSPRAELAEYTRFVENPMVPSMNEFYRSKKIPGVLGNKAARRLVENNTGYTRYWKPPQRPEINEILSAVAQVFETTEELILKSQRGRLNQPRRAAVYVAHSIYKHSARELSECLGMKISAVTQAAMQIKRMLLENSDIERHIQTVKEIVMVT